MSPDPNLPAPRRPALHRSDRGKMVAGVCVGLSETFGIPAWVFRIIFIVGNFLPGPGLFVYAILWVVMPMRRES
jgi:phage shock protein PspC (stress-responsive transcriptional regulator)